MPIVDLELVFERLSDFPIRTFEEGDVVLSAGSRSGRLLFLIHGAVDVVEDQWRIARVTEPGAVFGDMAALRSRPHEADVLAVRRSSFVVVDDGASCLKTEPLVALYVAVVQSGRLDAADRQLIAARASSRRTASATGCAWQRSRGSAAPCVRRSLRPPPRRSR
jgi:CRP/FNR family cyclic AMP-dependent transcriptional regulator